MSDGADAVLSDTVKISQTHLFFWVVIPQLDHKDHDGGWGQVAIAKGVSISICFGYSAAEAAAHCLCAGYPKIIP